MATNWHNVEGFVKWTKAYEPDEINGSRRWIVNFYPKDEQNKERIRKSGVELQFRADEDGEFVRIRRDCKKLIKDDLVIFTPPKINGLFSVIYRDQEGNEIRSVTKGDGKTIVTDGEQKLIPNLTKVLINFCVYDTAKGKGHRWESMKILELGPEYVPADAPTTEDEPKMEVKVEEPATGSTVKAKKGEVLSTEKGTPTIAEDMNDEIPW